MNNTFAENSVSYPDGQSNVNQPSDAVMLSGFTPRTSTNPGMPLPAQWLNWLFRQIFRLLGRDVTTTNTGVGLFTVNDATLQLIAYDRGNANNYLYAVGYKGAAGVAPVFRIVSVNGLSLGPALPNGTQSINGGVDVIVTGISRQIGDL